LIAYALSNPDSRCVVSGEASAPRKQRANRKVPDVCADVGVLCKGKFKLTADLGFTAR